MNMNINGFELLNDKAKGFAITNKTGTMQKYTPVQFQLLCLTIYNYSDKNSKISGKEVIDELTKTSDSKKIEYFKEYQKLLSREPELFSYITEKNESEFDIQNIESAPKDYIVKTNEGVKNYLYELIEQASKDMNFMFGGKFTLATAKNMKLMSKFLEKVQPEVPFTEIEKTYKMFITRAFDFNEKNSKKTKDISMFVDFLEDYYINGEKDNIIKKMSGIHKYLEITGKKVTKYNLGNAYNYFGNFAKSIIEVTNDDPKELKRYTEFLQEFSREYKQNNLTWTLKTAYNKLISEKKYQKYLGKEYKQEVGLLSTENKNSKENYEKEFQDYIKEIKETNKNMQKSLYKIYKEKGLEYLKNNT